MQCVHFSPSKCAHKIRWKSWHLNWPKKRMTIVCNFREKKECRWDFNRYQTDLLAVTFRNCNYEMTVLFLVSQKCQKQRNPRKLVHTYMNTLNIRLMSIQTIAFISKFSTRKQKNNEKKSKPSIRALCKNIIYRKYSSVKREKLDKQYENVCMCVIFLPDNII